MNIEYQIREWVQDVSAQDNWLKGEPSLHEVLTDPIVRLVMRRDNLGPADVWVAIDRARGALNGRALYGREEPSRDVA